MEQLRGRSSALADEKGGREAELAELRAQLRAADEKVRRQQYGNPWVAPGFYQGFAGSTKAPRQWLPATPS